MEWLHTHRKSARNGGLTKSISRRDWVNTGQSHLNGRGVLLISLSGYSSGILKKLKELGAQADLISDKPDDGFFCKMLGRLQAGFYQEVLHAYYQKELVPLKERDYDFIICIRGEYTPVKTLKLLKSYYPHSRLILYMWDGLHKFNTRGIEAKWPYYDRVYTFDRMDYENHKTELDFLPLYYYEDCIPDRMPPADSSRFRYDLSFIGTGHDDRIRIVKNVMDQCAGSGLRCFSYFYMPHRMIYLKNKALNRDFKNVKKADVRFRMLPFQQMYRIYAHSKCIIDVENAGQHGLTMRSMEVLGLRRKLVTTNRDIVNYDFYHPDNILVLDRKNPVIDTGFFKTPYKMLNERIYEKYSLSSWIQELLKQEQPERNC